jgi:hypothetical protein
MTTVIFGCRNCVFTEIISRLLMTLTPLATHCIVASTIVDPEAQARMLLALHDCRVLRYEMPLQSSQSSSPEARYHLIQFVIMTRMQVSANSSEFDGTLGTVLSVNMCTSKHENCMYSPVHDA